MDKKVDTALMGGQKNDMSGRAPLAPGYDELQEGKPGAADALSKAVTKTEKQTPYAELNTDENIDANDPDYEPCGPAPEPAKVNPSSGEVSEVDMLKAELAKLTKRLEDFGAIPREADLTPPEPVVTETKAGNIRTDW